MISHMLHKIYQEVLDYISSLNSKKIAINIPRLRSTRNETTFFWIIEVHGLVWAVPGNPEQAVNVVFNNGSDV